MSGFYHSLRAHPTTNGTDVYGNLFHRRAKGKLILDLVELRRDGAYFARTADQWSHQRKRSLGMRQSDGFVKVGTDEFAFRIFIDVLLSPQE